ncbi:MAG: ubiquinol-cytochrome c reductase iron-sulfur subunit, partial [Armatimonadota bacterium]
EAVEVGDASDIPVGQGKVVQVDATPVLVIRTEERLVAFSAVCTHLGCIVAWDPERKQIHCPCHAGVFDINGNVVSGPPPRPLPPYQVEEVGGKIMVRSA